MALMVILGMRLRSIRPSTVLVQERVASEKVKPVRGVDGLCGEGEGTPDWRVSITTTRNMGELPPDRKFGRSVLIHNIHYFLCE